MSDCDTFTIPSYKLQDCVLFQGFDPQAEFFCSFSSYNSKGFTSTFISYRSSDECMIYSFAYHKFYIAKSFSTAYGQFLNDVLERETNIKRTTNSVNGRDVSLLNFRKEKRYSLICDDNVLNSDLSIPDDIYIPSAKKFSHKILDILIETGYDEYQTKLKLKETYEKFINKHVNGR